MLRLLAFTLIHAVSFRKHLYKPLKISNAMAADYDFRRKPNEKGDGGLQPLYPNIVSKGTIDSKRLFYQITEASIFTEGDLTGLLVAIQEKMSYYLNEGDNVKLEEIGYFSTSLKVRPVMERRRRSVLYPSLLIMQTLGQANGSGSVVLEQ